MEFKDYLNEASARQLAEIAYKLYKHLLSFFADEIDKENMVKREWVEESVNAVLSHPERMAFFRNILHVTKELRKLFDKDVEGF